MNVIGGHLLSKTRTNPEVVKLVGPPEPELYKNVAGVKRQSPSVQKKVG
jgi:hypothetical protein